jgi:hypothetical protein
MTGCGIACGSMQRTFSLPLPVEATANDFSTLRL